jgi:hypothetical protein
MITLPEAQNALHKLFACLDERRYEEVLAFFTPEGEWLRQGNWCKGRKEILSSLASRSATQQISHLITNSYFERNDDTSALVASYMTTYKSDEVANGIAVRIKGPSSVFRTQTEFTKDESGWRIRRQSSTLLFKFESGD